MLTVVLGSYSQVLVLSVLPKVAVPGNAFSRYERAADTSHAIHELVNSCLPPIRKLPIPILGRRSCVLKLGVPVHVPLESQPFEPNKLIPGVLSFSE
jgi:hypothetical protein